MKKSTLLLLVTALITFNGCDAIKGLMVYDTSPTLNNITDIKALPTMNSVGFEWEKITQRDIHGINIYRASPQERSVKLIGTLGNRYATHFVDTHVKPNTQYLYTFTTFSLGRESKRSKLLRVQTSPTFSAVSFVQAYKETDGVVKILWKPHHNERISAYIIKRSVNGGAWKFVSQAEGHLMVEYIDTFVRRGSQYSYRIIAKSYDGIEAKASQATHISL